MTDRVPTYPGRVLITPELGSAYYATVTMADEPTEEGTALNKATLLQDATAALYGMTNAAVPDDVLAYLGKYNQYWWKRRTTPDQTVSRSTSIISSTTMYNVSLQGYTQAVETTPAGDWEFITDSDRNAYPDSGVQDDYEYVYLGIPFDNAVEPVKIATGSYVGTGMYEENDPNTLTFDFEPKLLLVSYGTFGLQPNGGYWQNCFIWFSGNQTVLSGGSSYDNTFSLDGNALSWYGKSAGSQCNILNATYSYIAIG